MSFCNPSSISQIKNVISISGATTAVTLTPQQSGSLVQIGVMSGASLTITMPTPAKGLNYDFVCTAIPAKVVTINCGATNLQICAIAQDVTAVDTSGGSQNILLSATSAVSDGCTIQCYDGVKWTARAFVKVHTTLTTS